MVNPRLASAAAMIVLFLSSCNRKTPTSWIFEPNASVVMGVASPQDLTVDSSGALGMLVVNKEGVGYMMSHDGGDNFMHLIPVSESGAAVNAQAESTPTLAKVPTAIYALWEQKTGVSSDLMLGRSLTYGHSFEKPVRVNDDETAFHGYSAVAAASGDVYVVWLDGREGGPSSETFSIYFARSKNQGATFEKNCLVAHSACPCCRPRIAVGENGDVYIAWRKVFPGDVRDMVVSTSHDGGETFGSEVRVADDGWYLRGCPHSGASIVQSGSRLYLAWLTEGRERGPRIQLSWSDDRGGHFHAPISVSAGSLDPNHPVLFASEDHRVLLAFQARRQKTDGAWQPSTIFVAEVIGDRVSTPIALPNGGNSISYPHLAVGTGGRAYLAWTQRTEQTSDAVLIRGRYEQK